MICWGCEDEENHIQQLSGISNLSKTDITEFSAICAFTIEPVGTTQRAGVILGFDDSFLSDTSKVSTTEIADGNISLNLSSLHADTEYYYKAFISDKNNSVIYSDVGQFRTKPLIFNTSAATIEASYIAGQYSFTITSNVEWTIASNQSWCTVQPVSGNGNRDITVSVTENNTGTPRSATLTITAGNQSRQVTVEQGIDNTMLNVSVSTINAPHTAGQHTFTITSNAAWEILNSQYWCTTQPTYGNGNREITVSVEENNTGTPRTATITIIAGTQSRRVTIEQGIDNTTLNVSIPTINAPYMAGQHSFTVTSNAAWTIASNQSWCTVQPVSGNGNRDIAVSVSENNTGMLRTATITIMAGNQSRQITVDQDYKGTNEFGNGITPALSFGGGNGSQGSPYLISDARQLKKLVDDVNNRNNFANIYFELMSDIHVSANEWIPIGHESSFLGNFDGNGYTISGVLKSDKYSCFGFFGRLDGYARISNLTITATVKNEMNDVNGKISILTGAITGMGWLSNIDSNIIIQNCHVTGTVSGSSCVGGIVGWGTYFSIQNCTISGNISCIAGYYGQLAGGIGGFVQNSVIANCSVFVPVTVSGGDATVTGNGSSIGGIIGTNHNSKINNCTNNGNVIGGTGFCLTGGITGINSGEINNCINNGTVIGGSNINYAGGISGQNQEAIIDCTNNADVSGRYVGGLSGYNYSNGWNNPQIHTSLNIGNIFGENSYFRGGLVGFNQHGSIYSCCTNRGTVNGETANDNNQIGNGNLIVEPCPNGHTKR